ncbi:MAG: ABC transporter permease [Bacteriovoracaceae bacterium]|nr:ABC transporter permease [Bacteriovoracaceae bacterium]
MQLKEWQLIWYQSVDLTFATLKSRYRKTLAGFVWVLLNPIIMFGVQSTVFRTFLKLEIRDYYLFLVSGLIPWVFMSQTIQMGTPSILSSSSLLKAFKLHPLVLVTSSVLDNLFNFLFAIALIIIPVIQFSESGFNGNIFLAPLFLLPFVIGTFAMTCFFSLLNVFYRDTNFVLGFAFSILFFLTPIFYPASYVPENYRWMIELNPFYHLISPFRACLYPTENGNLAILFAKGMAWSLGLSAVTIYYWRKKRNELFIAL